MRPRACCSISNELSDALQRLSRSGEYDQIIVEMSGVAEPDMAKANLKKAAPEPLPGVLAASLRCAALYRAMSAHIYIYIYIYVRT